MAKRHLVSVGPLPSWLDRTRFLGDESWLESKSSTGITASCELETASAADVAARLRNLGLNGHALNVECNPPLKRNAVRAARTQDARRRRNTTPGFEHPRARTHPDGRIGLTPERLAQHMAEEASGKLVFDACCGIGGNSIGFARSGCTVYAVEQRPELIQIARENANAFGVRNRITFKVGDTLQHLPKETNICFVDPPWGLDWDRIKCELSSFPLAKSLWTTFKQTPTWDAFWLKVPSSFVPASLDKPTTTTAIFGEAAGDRQRIKFLLIKVSRKDL